LKIFYNLSKLLIIRNLTLQTFNFMTFYTELKYEL
jgi:predicted transposase YdaD